MRSRLCRYVLDLDRGSRFHSYVSVIECRPEWAKALGVKWLVKELEALAEHRFGIGHQTRS